MIKAFKFIGIILTILIIATFPISCSDEYDDSLLTDRVDNLENRVNKLEELCSQMNTNIGSLQTLIDALQERDYITNVTPITKEDKTIGYTIAFAKSNPITIYHGKNGENGKDGEDGVSGNDGKDGETPIIGVKKHTDGIYYWTVNNEWLLDENGNKIKAEGKDGSDGSDGEDGTDGSDGSNGTNGTVGKDGNDGITPKLKIENGYWFVSYDNGSTWTELGKATGEDGENGTNGTNGDSFFQSVDTSSKDYVVFTLSNGTSIQLPTWTAFENLQTLCNQMNTNITSLQTIVNALQNNDYIKSVTPVMENGKEIGYTITFAKNNAITIYHGMDGKDGENGSDGSDGTNGSDGVDGKTPIIGVKQDTDGIYYWTVNNEWLADEAGNKVKAQGTDGSDGSNGNNGTNGSNGKDGITPNLKIEEGYWYVSYDNGSTWTKLDKATGEDGKDGENGTNGTDGKDGDSFFQNVDTSSKDYVVFTLSNGTTIQLPTWTAFENLQTLCNQMNTNITSLQTIVNALQNNDYIKNVTPLMENGVTIGYTITFDKSSPITIYNGKDGANGTNGSNGSNGENGKTPVIGVKKDTDNIYYWTVNGEWLLNEDGNKVKAQGKDGSNGSNGSNGANGNDGITPKLKIENSYWFVSYDNGSTWAELGKATGEDGENGTNGTNGDSFFQSVDTSSKDYVVFTLSNGTTIQLPTWAAFKELQTFCNQMNTNITSLQTIVNALQNNDYIKNVTPLMENGVTIGYTITFDKSSPITIYNGKDGANGTNGSNGSNGENGKTPVIGVKKDTDNIYYWTVNGEWLLNEDGNKVKAQGKDGSNGSNGSNGANGNDGITPKLKIENGYWFVSYDNGSTWTELGKATGENGTNGDNIFSSVTQDENNVYFNLTDGTTITISKNGSSTPKPTDYIQFEDVNVKALCLKWDTNYDGELSYEEAAKVKSLGTTFKGNTTIRLFKELHHFTGLSSLSSAFYGCTGLTYVNIPANVTNIYNAFNECNSLIYINIPSNVNTIGENAFLHCSSLKTVIIPNSVSSIGKWAFNGCESLETIDIPSSVNTIGVYAFSRCESLTSITLPYGVTTLEQGAFADCTSLVSVNIANSLKTIGVLAFDGCTSLVSITLPNSVETIEEKAFAYCSSLKEIYCEATTPPTIDNSTSNTFKYIVKLQLPLQ